MDKVGSWRLNVQIYVIEKFILYIKKNPRRLPWKRKHGYRLGRLCT